MFNQNTSSFHLKKHPSMSMEFKNLPQSATAQPPRSSSSFSIAPGRSRLSEFPTSPYFFPGSDEITHFNHPQHHQLAEIDLADLFTCGGCKEYGSGKRFTCLQCNFQLHYFCASPPQSLKGHPFHCHHPLFFHKKPAYKGGILKSKCDACSKSINGYNFRCSVCSFQMHPCCAKLSTEMNFPRVHPHNLKLLAVTPSTNNNGDNPGFLCGECKRKRSGRVYGCRVEGCDYRLHAVCAKNMINGLQANDIKGVEKQGRLGAAARVASQVLTDFIGGLMEGIGEGFGEVIVQNMARGRNNNNANYKQIN